MKDGKNNILKIGDTIQSKGKAGKLENINGMTLLVFRSENGMTESTVVLRKVDLSLWELVK